MNIVQRYFRRASINRTRRKHRTKVKDAEKAVTVKYVDNAIRVTIEDVPIIEVISENLSSPNHLPFCELTRYLRDLRKTYMTHCITKPNGTGL